MATLPAPDARRSALWRQLLAWSPVLLALALLGQLALFGLRPAVAERRRLAEAEQELRTRLLLEEWQAHELERVERAQNDPIYLERERRALKAAGADGQRDEESRGAESDPAGAGDGQRR